MSDSLKARLEKAMALNEQALALSAGYHSVAIPALDETECPALFEYAKLVAADLHSRRQALDQALGECVEALVFPYDIDCGDNSCRFAKKRGTGMRTNGGCRCENFFAAPKKVQDLLRHILRQQHTLAALDETLRKMEGGSE